jgi:hypothetical protein
MSCWTRRTALIANIIYDNGKSLIDHYRDMTGR